MYFVVSYYVINLMTSHLIRGHLGVYNTTDITKVIILQAFIYN